jgi:protein transport protein SEC31
MVLYHRPRTQNWPINMAMLEQGESAVISVRSIWQWTELSWIFTSNPYTGVSRPGIAQVAPGKAPVSATLNFDSVQLPALYEPIKDGLLQITTSLASSPLAAADKRQLSEAEKGVAILVKRLARGDIDATVVEKVSKLVGSLLSRDYNTTNIIQKQLVNDDWKEHKDWLKGVKFLIQLASKRL